jgi:hypothetical protein
VFTSDILKLADDRMLDQKLARCARLREMATRLRELAPAEPSLMDQINAAANEAERVANQLEVIEKDR